MKYEVIIPTRDSANRIGVFLEAYRKLGIEPLYVVDARSVDGTVDALASLGARMVVFEPSADFAEAGMIACGARAASTDWIFRLDDDEAPSRALIDWLAHAEVDAPVIAACRREVHFADGRHVYSRWPTRLSPDRSAVNYQYRIFRRDLVTYVEKVHTAGYEIPSRVHLLPGDLFLVHLNCVLHDVAFRLSKVRKYARLDERGAWAVVDECLPEYLDQATQAYRSDGLAEFRELFAGFQPPSPPAALPPLSDRERRALDDVARRAVEASRDLYKYDVSQMIARRLGWAPKPLLREVSKLVCSATAAGSSSLRIWGDALWDYAAAPKRETPPEGGKMRFFDMLRSLHLRPAATAHESNAALTPPRFVFLSINKRCNLRCEHCVFWRDDDKDSAAYLSRDGRRRVLAELQQMNPSASVVICGGESMLDLEDYFDVAGTCRRLGLTCISVVNGTRIRSAEMAERMIKEGPHEISISLNSQRPDLHDRTRGVPGAFEKATNALRLLRDARARLGAKDTKIYAMGLVFAENYRELPDFYDFVLNDLRIDKLKLNFIQPSFGGAEEDRFFADQSAVDPDELVEIISACDARFSLGLNPVWLRQVHMYFSSLSGAKELEKGWGSGFETREHLCNTYDRNVMVDHYGVARLCFASDFRGAKLENNGDLRRFWTGAGDIRRQMRACNRPCGISHSVRDSSSTLAAKRLSAPLDPLGSA